MIQQMQSTGLVTDPPGEQAGTGALAIENMIPRSAVSVQPRPGVTEYGEFHTTSGFDARRVISLFVKHGDTSYTTFVVCSIWAGGTNEIPIVEALFPTHLGKTVYDFVDTQTNDIYNIKTIYYAGLGGFPPNCVQYGNKAFLYYPDLRPLVIMGSALGPVSYECGLLAPTQACTANTTTVTANNLTRSDVDVINQIQFSYAFFSSSRGVYSQPAELTYYTIPSSTPVKKILVSGFAGPRDGIDAGAVDYIVVGARSGTNSGLMVLFPDTVISTSTVALTGTATATLGSATLVGTGTAFLAELVIGMVVNVITESYVITAIADNTHLTLQVPATATQTNAVLTRDPALVFDLSPDQLSFGFDLNALAGSLYISPSVKYCERFGEEIWLGGQRNLITFDPSLTVTVQKAQLTGTVSITNGSATMTGVGTAFLTELVQFDRVAVNGGNAVDGGQTFFVLNISSDTSLTFTSISPVTATTVNAARIYRGFPAARVTASVSIWNTAYLYYQVYVNNTFLGNVFDMDSGFIQLYLDTDIGADISSTSNIELRGVNDRIWRTSYDANTPGNVPTVFPECAQMDYPQLLTQALDDGQQLTGLKATNDQLRVFFDNSISRLVGGNEVGQPLPDIRQYYGRAGAISPRSIAKAPTGELCWVGTEGLYVDTDSNVRNISAELGCQYLFRGGQWIARADLPGISVGYSRDMNGFIFGPFTINGEANWWGLLTFIPQTGIFLFNGQKITSNIVEYLDGNGRGITLCGDDQGRIKWLLDDSMLTDVALLGTNAAAAYRCLYQPMWNLKPDYSVWSPVRAKLVGLMPQTADYALTLRMWRSLYPERERSRMIAINADAEYTVDVDQDSCRQPMGIPLDANAERCHSFGYYFDSTQGSFTDQGVARPMEVNGIIIMEKGEA